MFQELQGSEKQVAWANQIRDEFVVKVHTRLSAQPTEIVDQVLEGWVNRKVWAKASTWINERATLMFNSYSSIAEAVDDAIEDAAAAVCVHEWMPYGPGTGLRYCPKCKTIEDTLVTGTQK